MGAIQTVRQQAITVAAPPSGTSSNNSSQPAYDTLVDQREALIRELVTVKHHEARNNAIALRAYQLRPRKLMSNAQQAAFVVATAHFGVYALPALPVLATTFTVKRHAAKSLSFHVWKQFTEHAKDKPQQKAIHGALKRHGIIQHDDTVVGTLGRNHWRTLTLPTDAEGELDAQDLDARMAQVMGDLAMSGLWTDAQLAELQPDITRIVEQFAALSHDLDKFGHAWGDANVNVKKLQFTAKLSDAGRADLVNARVERADIKRRIVVGDDAADAQLLQAQIDTAIARSRTYTAAGAGRDVLAMQNDGLLRELVIAKHKALRNNEIAFRAYQLRTRKLMSNTQQAGLFAVTAPICPYVLPLLPAVATTFTAKRHAAQSLSFHVWQHFTEHAKDKPQQKAIHGALKRHGIVHHENTPWGWVGRNHWRTLELPTDDAGHIKANLLSERLDAVVEDLKMAALWSEPQLTELRGGIATILTYFASLNADLHTFSDAWGKANRDVKKHWLGAHFSSEQKQKYQAARAKRAEIKHHITVGDDSADDARLAQELEAVLTAGH